MDEAHITITVKPIYVERIIYWVVILILAVLLVMAYLRDCEVKTDTTNTQTTTPPAENDEPAAPATNVDIATCVDDVKNQDETDVDCGGSCGTCAIGKACKVANDCASKNCVANLCGAAAPAAPTTTLSGKVTVDLKNLEVQKAPSSNARKVTSVDYSIDNGLDKDLGTVTLEFFIRSKKQPTYCLNQQPKDGNDCEVPYATLTTTGPRSGKKIDESNAISGRYLIAEPPIYDPESTSLDSFIVEMYVYDQTGNPINGLTLVDSYNVDP